MRNANFKIWGVSILTFTGCILAIAGFLHPVRPESKWLCMPPPQGVGVPIPDDEFKKWKESDEYKACVAKADEQYQDVDYKQTQDIAKAFLTLLAALFAGTITFSEKIVDIKKSPSFSVWMMVVCWALLLVANSGACE